MTLTDKDNNNQETFTSDLNNSCKTVNNTMPEKLKMPLTNPNQVGLALKEVIHQAIEQNRVTFGLYEAGQLLETCPEEVMLCVLPENDDNDVTLHIHFTLIEAFCWENGIRLIKVDKAENLKKTVCDMVTVGENNNIEEQRMLTQQDYNCLLIEYPVAECSEADEDMIEYYKVIADISPQPVVQLPV